MDYANLRFVRNQETIEKVEASALSEAAKAVKDIGEEIVWVDAPSGKDVDRESVYVLATFNTPIFHVLFGKARVVGPMVVLACIKNRLPLPVGFDPTFTYSMHGVVLCCTQTGSKDRRDSIGELVKLMGGKTVANFTRHVTHLIAGQVGSSKYTVARSLNIPVLSPSWVESSWKEGRQSLMDATDNDFMSRHRCPTFSGCVISCTGFTSDERGSLQDLITTHGASYDTQLTKDASTHLIVGSTASEKYRYAVQWGVKCVTSQWLYDSISTGYCQDEATYLVEDCRKRASSVSDCCNDSKRLRHSTGDSDGLFHGLKLAISTAIARDTKDVITKEVNKNGGVVVAEDSACHYYVAPLSLPPSPHPLAHNIVTIIWFERSLEAGTLLDHTSYFLFQPLAHSLNSTLLNGCVITISQFSGLEREHLAFLATSLGAMVQDCFARYPNGSLLATTHLVLKEPCGDKYQSALSWNVPSVSEKWLFECASSQMVASVDDYKMAPPSDYTPPSLHTKTPLRSFRPHFDVDNNGDLDTAVGNDTMMETLFHDHMEKALDTVTMETKSPKVNPVLAGVILYVHKKLCDHQNHYHKMVTALGGRCRKVYNRTCTHILYQGKDISRDKLLQSAKDNGCHITSQYWLLNCYKSGTREDELLYPYNYNPRQSLSITLSQKRSPCDEANEGDVGSIAQGGTKDSNLERQLKELIETAEQNHSRRQRRFTNKVDVVDASVGGDLLKVEPASHGSQVTDSQLLSITYANDNHDEKLLALIQDTETQPEINDRPHLQSKDPQRRSLHGPVGTALHRRNTRSSLSMSHCNTIGVSHNDNRQLDTRDQMLEPKFLLSSLSSSEKADYGALIHELGGVYIDSDHYSNHCTHLVVGKASRTEKYLAACASGKWVLAKSYLEACRDEGKFVDEEPYEWSKHSLHKTPLDCAPAKWRSLLKSTDRGGAFQGWQVLLNAEENKQNGLRRLLEAGGAKVLTITMTTQTAVSSLTHAFLNANNLPKSKHLSPATLHHCGVKCLRPEYIAEYLQKEEVDIGTYLLHHPPVMDE